MSSVWGLGHGGIDPLSVIIVLILERKEEIDAAFMKDLASAVVLRAVSMRGGQQPTGSELAKIAQEVLVLGFELCQGFLTQGELIDVIATTKECLEEVAAERPPEVH